MYREARSNKNPQVSLVQIVTSIVVVVVALVLPIYLVDKARNSTPTPYTAESLGTSTNSKGRVAGLSTVIGTNKITIPFTTTQIDIDSQAGGLLIIGCAMIIVAAGIILFLIATSGRRRK